ncbi:MAG: TaqI family restriction endonuclease [Firmicutes bacterium]|nr:TaqI family restriction endonuclease [Bacillota bacterium]
MTQFSREQFETFLAMVDLSAYRERFIKIKSVEMDLHKSIHALETIYKEYWDNGNNRIAPLMFDEYYDIYLSSCRNEIEKFKVEKGFGSDCECFNRGLKARIYRTWTAILTQIQAGLVAKEVFANDKIEMSAELDYKKVDILIIKQNGERIEIQVKKDTNRSEMRRMIGHGTETEIAGEKY